MGNPTKVFSWAFPTEMQSPFWPGVDSIVAAIDAAVASASAGAQVYVTQVISAWPTNTFTIPSSFDPNGAYPTVNNPYVPVNAQPFVTLSAAPYGKFAGGFRVWGPGQVTLRWSLEWMGGVGSSNVNSGSFPRSHSAWAFWRVVLNPGNITLTGDSHWFHRAKMLSLVETQRGVLGPFSLGLGVWSVELQMRWQPITLGAESNFGMHPPFYCTMFAEETG